MTGGKGGGRAGGARGGAATRVLGGIARRAGAAAVTFRPARRGGRR